jgi:hypothetical protein
MPAIAILAGIDKAMRAVFDHLQDSLSPKPKALHYPRSISVQDNVRFVNKLPQPLFALGRFQIQVAVPLTPVQVRVDWGKVNNIWPCYPKDTGTKFSETPRDRWACNNPS